MGLCGLDRLDGTESSSQDAGSEQGSVCRQPLTAVLLMSAAFKNRHCGALMFDREIRGQLAMLMYALCQNASSAPLILPAGR